MLQNLANKPSYAKETYMIPTNPFVEFNKQRTNKFLNDLCEVVDFYEQLEMDQYMALSKKDIMINITPNEIYSTLSLLQQHINIIAPKDTDHLRILINEVGVAPAQVPRKENKPIELPLFSRWEMPIQGILFSIICCLGRNRIDYFLSLDLTMSLMSENNITQNDILYMEAKSIFVQIIRSLPHLARTPIKLYYIAETAGTAKDAQLVHKGIKVKEMLRELEEAGVIDRRDNHQLLVEEINHELAHLGDLKLKVMEELGSLESVYKTILDHNNYLKSQLESYKAYLQNVRMQSGAGVGSGGGNSKKQIVGIGVEVVNAKPSKKTNKAPAVQGPFKFTHQQLEKDGIIAQTEVPEHRRDHIFLTISSPIPGTFIIALNYKGRDKPVLEIDLKLDDLLEKVNIQVYLFIIKKVKELTYHEMAFIATRWRPNVGFRIHQVKCIKNIAIIDKDLHVKKQVKRLSTNYIPWRVTDRYFFFFN
jgi:Ras GTPase-activating-like protein IQGAP2/3